MKQWSSPNARYFTTHFIAGAIGALVCIFLPDSKSKPDKEYPIQITLIMGSNYMYMDADSVVNGMAYKDSIKIKLDNVACIKFK
jgi:hypothetical protein